MSENVSINKKDPDTNSNNALSVKFIYIFIGSNVLFKVLKVFIFFGISFFWYKYLRFCLFSSSPKKIHLYSASMLIQGLLLWITAFIQYIIIRKRKVYSHSVRKTMWLDKKWFGYKLLLNLIKKNTQLFDDITWLTCYHWRMISKYK